ncbi:hypothetical protein EIP75_17330 [Aquabacterium soli]|uniref:Type II secretion system protein GspC N-terminal domain-containing protein n=1 Tax=Aquabacterium soli TaxID=2493092 RepID=A0A3R8U258_9BURK|nr:hypothetical protein [Aquabacterium soli]RRS03084.1 hypothetical protein EIP75_17330 [Aquabacterium soli]
MTACRWLTSILAAAGVLTGALSWAADVIVLPDPTRPPNAVLRSMSAKSAGGVAPVPVPAQAASDAASGASAPRASRREGRLTSVRVSPGYASVALLDGRLVQLGDRVGDSTVASIDEDGVVLRGPRGQERLSLIPTAGKRRPGMDYPAKSGGKETR